MAFNLELRISNKGFMVCSFSKSTYRVVQKKVDDHVCSLHLIKNRLFFVIFSFCIPKHTICVKQTFFYAAEKALHISKKSKKNLVVKNQKKKVVKLLF